MMMQQRSKILEDTGELHQLDDEWQESQSPKMVIHLMAGGGAGQKGLESAQEN